MCATTATNTPSCPKTLILFGSPRRDGVSACLLDVCVGATKNATVVDCYKKAVAPCDDCRGCHTRVGCVKRDMDDVYAALEEAERLIFIAPVYNRSFPAPMKAMIDRLQCYWAKRFVHGVRPPIAVPKTALLITAAGSDRNDGAHLLEQLKPALTVLHVTDVQAVHVDNTDRGVDWEETTRQILKRL